MDDISALYDSQGYIAPFDAFSNEQAQQYRRQLETAEQKHGLDQSFREMVSGSANFTLPFVDEITRLPALIDPVKQILGPDLLVWGASFFNKEPDSSDFVSWHQDLTYWGLNDLQEVTAWVALSNVTEASGCMRFIPQSHKNTIIPHRDTFSDDNLLSRGQYLDLEIDESQAVQIELNPGQFSLHHGRMFHASGPNRSGDRRIGLAIRYISTAMHQNSGEKPYVHLVAGEDRFGHFLLMPPTTETMSPKHIKAVQHNTRVQHQDLFANAEKSGEKSAVRQTSQGTLYAE